MYYIVQGICNDQNKKVFYLHFYCVISYTLGVLGAWRYEWIWKIYVRLDLALELAV